MSHGPVPAAAAGDMPPVTTAPPASARAAPHRTIACLVRRSRDRTVVMENLPFRSRGHCWSGTMCHREGMLALTLIQGEIHSSALNAARALYYLAGWMLRQGFERTSC